MRKKNPLHFLADTGIDHYFDACGNQVDQNVVFIAMVWYLLNDRLENLNNGVLLNDCLENLNNGGSPQWST